MLAANAYLGEKQPTMVMGSYLGGAMNDGFSRSKLVPPIGVEPTLGTLLRGSPLPLGYGGGSIVTASWLSAIRPSM